MKKEYKWSQTGANGSGAVMVCEIDGKSEMELFKNYAKMVYEMTKEGWKPEGWTYNKDIRF